jgi:hypothetical protein
MAVVMMFLAFKQWVFTLSAIAIIDEAMLSKVGSLISYRLFIATAQALMHIATFQAAFCATQNPGRWPGLRNHGPLARSANIRHRTVDRLLNVGC